MPNRVSKHRHLKGGERSTYRGSNVEQDELLDLIGCIECHTMCDPSAAVVRDNKELVVAQLAHELDHVACHFALRVPRVSRPALGCRAVVVAVAAVVRHHHIPASLGSKRRCDVRPDHVCLRMAVQQQDAALGLVRGWRFAVKDAHIHIKVSFRWRDARHLGAEASLVEWVGE